jgi:hypothetical protein
MKIRFALFIVSLASTSIVNAQSWLTTGNSGTAPATNFLGTIDSKDVVFKTSNVERGRMIALSGTWRLGNATNYAKIDSTGKLTFGGTGVYQVGNNKYVFQNATNKKLGLFYSSSIPEYQFRDSLGSSAFTINPRTGNEYLKGKLGIGKSALYKLDVAGDINIDSGAIIRRNGVPILIIGDEVSGSTFIGNGGTQTNTGIGNVGIGSESLTSNTTGNYNTAIGHATLLLNTSGGYNVGVGFQALVQSTSGYYNVAIGRFALGYDTSAALNVAVGPYAGDGTYNGNYNTFLGYSADCHGTGITNSTAMGSNSHLTASNQVRVGDGSVTSIGGQVGWTTLSDGRVKKNIKENIPGLAFINKLKPISYNLDENAVDKITQNTSANIRKEKLQPTQQELTARKQKEQIVYTGFVAQDVEKAAREISYDFSGVDAAKNNNDLYGLRYGDFVVPLVKAVQELSAQNDELKKENDELKKRLDKVESLLNGNTNSIQEITINTTAKLEQNAPNPVSGLTSISYYIPSNTNSVFVNFYSTDGTIIKTEKVSGKGKGLCVFNTQGLTSGTYSYALVVDGKIVDKKQLIVMR